MKFHSFFRLTLTFSVTLLAAGAFNLSAADWGSLHGNNRSTPSAPAFRPQPGPIHAPQVNHAPAPVIHQEPIRTPEPRQTVQPVREQPRQEVRPVDRVPTRPVVVERTRAGEMNRRRMDIDEDRRQSYFWSDYHAGMRIDRLPDGYRRFRLHNHDFFFFGGVYYDSGPAGYVVCAPPVGAYIPELPPGTETIQVGDTIYYYVAGAFYVQQPDGSFVVVAAPLGVTVSLLPPDAASVVINGMGYFQADGVYYQPVMQNGVTAYLTIPPP
jgi:hypothetical protein